MFCHCLLCHLELKSFCLFSSFQSANVNHTIWPHPQHLNTSSRRYYLLSSDDFTIVDNSSFTSGCEIITEAIKRYRDRFFIEDCRRLNPAFTGHYFHPRNADPTSFLKADGPANFLGVLRNVTLTLSPGATCEKLPHLGMKEEYFVTVDERGGGAEISAHSVWGLLRGEPFWWWCFLELCTISIFTF